MGAGRADEDAAEKGEWPEPREAELVDTGRIGEERCREGGSGASSDGASTRWSRASEPGRCTYRFTAWGLSIYELAQVVTRTYGGRHCWSPWLNLWADDPERPLPAPPRAVAVEGRMAGATAAGAHETVCLDDGWIYQGEGLNRRPHGLVKLTWPSGEMYSGTRVHGTRHGNGTCRDVEGGVYVGAYRKRRALGPQSQCPWPNDRVYEGACRAGMRHGEAVETIPRGASRRCTGQWVEVIPRKAARPLDELSPSERSSPGSERKRRAPWRSTTSSRQQILRYHSILVQRPQRDSGNERFGTDGRSTIATDSAQAICRPCSMNSSNETSNLRWVLPP